MESKLEILVLAGIDRAITEDDTKDAAALGDQKPVMLALRKLGYSFKEIGGFFNRTPQWANNLLPRGSQAAPLVVADRIDPDKLAAAIWAEAAADLTWWGSRGRLIHVKLVKRFRDNKYSWTEARDYAKRYSISKLKVILMVTFRVTVTDEGMTEWFQGLLELHTKAEIFQKINEGQALQTEVRSFNRTWVELGLKSLRKARVRFEHQFSKQNQEQE